MADIFWYMSDRMSPDDENAYTQEEVDNIVEMVSESSFYEDESGMSIDDRMTEVFDSCTPKWSGFQTYEGFCCVNCTGVMHRGRERVEVVLQFSVSEDLDTFVLTGMLIDGVEQPEELIIEFESQFATESEYDDEDIDYEDFFEEGYTGGLTVPPPDVDPEEYAKWDALVTEALAAEALLAELEEDDEDDYVEDDDDYVEECGCGHHHHHDHHDDHEHHHHHDHDHASVPHTHVDDDDDEDDDYVPDWGDDAAERFWYGSDDDDWQDEE